MGVICMTLQELHENQAAGSTGADGVGNFAGRLFSGDVDISRYIEDPNRTIPVIRYSQRKNKTKEKKSK